MHRRPEAMRIGRPSQWHRRVKSRIPPIAVGHISTAHPVSARNAQSTGSACSRNRLYRDDYQLSHGGSVANEPDDQRGLRKGLDQAGPTMTYRRNAVALVRAVRYQNHHGRRPARPRTRISSCLPSDIGGGHRAWTDGVHAIDLRAPVVIPQIRARCAARLGNTVAGQGRKHPVDRVLQPSAASSPWRAVTCSGLLLQDRG